MKKSTFWTIIGIGAVGVLTGGAGFLAAPAIGAAVSAAGLGVAGGTLSGCAASSAGLAALGGGSLAAGGFGVLGGTIVVTGLSAAFCSGVTAACMSWERGEISKAKEEIKQMADKDHAQFKEFYNKNKANMSDDLRREWEKYL